MKKYTDQELISAVSTSKSYAQILKKLNRKPVGGNYQVLKKRIKALSLDTSHLTGQGWNKGQKFHPKRKIEEYLSNKIPITSHKLKLRLLKDNIFSHSCDNCKLSKWLDIDIPLELHHINGNNQDNTLNNLQLLCPNCHALTDNYRGKNSSLARR